MGNHLSDLIGGYSRRNDHYQMPSWLVHELMGAFACRDMVLIKAYQDLFWEVYYEVK